MHPIEGSVGVPSCNENPIDENAFPILYDIFDRIRKDGGRLSSHDEWFRSVCPPAPTPFRYEPSTSKRALISRTTEARNDLTLASRSLGQLFQRISCQATALEERLNALKLGSGLSSLPDEILSLVLEEAAYDVHSPTRTVKAATKLSHTCQRFRHLVVCLPQLWNRIVSDMPLEVVTLCCNHLAVPNADVHLNMDRRKPLPCPLPEFSCVTTSRSTFWRRYSFSGPFEIQDLNDLARTTSNLDAPELLELSVAYEYFEPDLAEDDEPEIEGYKEVLNYFSTWNMPRLSMLKISNFIPLPLRNPTSLKTLDLSVSMTYMDDRRLDLWALTTFLVSCEVLEVLNLNMSRIDGVLGHHRRVGLDHPTTASFTFDHCESDFPRNFFEGFHFSAVCSMKLLVLSEKWEDHTDGPIDNSLADIFPDTTAFPRLIDLDLGFSIVGERTKIQVNVPFSALQSVKNLTFSSFSSTLAPIRDERLLPALESLLMKDCEMLDVDWITTFLGRLIHRGNLQPSQFLSRRCMRIKVPEPNEPGHATERTRREQESITTAEILQLVMRT